MAKQDSEHQVLWSLNDVSFGYGDQEVISGLNLQLQSGLCYGILGPNGSGKTTLLDLFGGLHRPQTGNITFQGKALSQWPGKKLAQMVGLVPQDFMIRFGFSVREVVEMGLHPHLHRFAEPGEAEQGLVNQALKETGILEMADRPVTNLSGGEKQRVAVARALVQNPQVLLLDEPTSNLDIHHSLELLHLIRKRFDKTGLQVIAVLHDLNLASFFCDELIFLKGGKVRFQGPVEEGLTAEIIESVYGVEAQVQYNAFTACKQVSFRLAEESV